MQIKNIQFLYVVDRLTLVLDICGSLTSIEFFSSAISQFYALATKMKKDFVDAYINRGDVLIKLNKTEEALKCYQKAVHYGPNNAMAYFNVSNMYFLIG